MFTDVLYECNYDSLLRRTDARGSPERRWHHLPYVTHIEATRIVHKYW